jgi:hypothetical protein
MTKRKGIFIDPNAAPTAATSAIPRTSTTPA